jgi:hypothetical protein
MLPSAYGGHGTTIWQLAGSVDPTAGAGVAAPIGSTYARTDGTVWQKYGAGATAWNRTIEFHYTVTGGEADLSALVIALPATMPSTSYAVFVTQGTATAVFAMAVPVSSMTTTQFVLQLSGAATAGDIFNFIVKAPAG